DDAFAELQNAYIWRSRIKKRFGSTWMGMTQLDTRLRIQIGTTNGVTGNLGATNVPDGSGSTSQIKVGQIFSVGTVIFTVTALGNVDTLSTDATITGHINTGVTPNTFSITGNGVTNLGAPVYYYPANPVMGLTQYLTGAVNDHPSYAFDTQFAYLFSGGDWARSGTLLFH